jgi:hypothetical protein
MGLEKFVQASGVCVHAREEGVVYDDGGRIVVSHAGLHGVDEHLWACLRIAVDQLFLVINLSAVADDGASVTIGKVGPADRVGAPVTVDNPDAIRLVEYLRAHGFGVGEEGPQPCLLLGPSQTLLNPTEVDYSQQLVVTLPRGSASPLAPDRHREGMQTRVFYSWEAAPMTLRS